MHLCCAEQFIYIEMKTSKEGACVRYFFLHWVKCMMKLDLAFNNVKPKNWYFVLD